MKRRDIITKLLNAGFVLIRSNKHLIYSNGEIKVIVPNHNTINFLVAKQILKDAQIK